MSGYARWRDVRAEPVERAGGEAAVAAGKEHLLAEAGTPRPARSVEAGASRPDRTALPGEAR